MAKGAAANKAAAVIKANMAFTGSLASPRKIESSESFNGTSPLRLRKRMAASSSKMPNAKAASIITTQFWLMNCPMVTHFSPTIDDRDRRPKKLKN